MRAGPLLGALARALARRPMGRRLGVAVYQTAARLTAERLLVQPQVASVYLTGSLARPERLEPGYSDIDLVAILDLHSVRDEVRALESLSGWQRRVARLGGLFYNLDCIATTELPYARAFGGAYEANLDAGGVCLGARPLWTSPALRPPEELRRERFAVAVRRWINTGARLLDPTVRDSPAAMHRAARRLVLDVVEAWTNADLVRSPDLMRRAVEKEPAMTCAGIVARQGLSAVPESAVHSLLVPAALEILNTFAREMNESLQGEMGTKPTPRSAPSTKELDVIAGSLLGPVFDTVVLLQKDPGGVEFIPFVLAAPGVVAREVVAEMVARAPRAAAAYAALGHWSRRPVPLTPALWSACGFMEPAPFLGASAVHPTLVIGRGAAPPRAPDDTAMLALLRARVVQSFIQCRGPELRPRQPEAHRARALAARFALLGALDRALDDGILDMTDDGSAHALSRFDRAQRLQEFSARHRARLEPLLGARLGPASKA